MFHTAEIFFNKYSCNMPLYLQLLEEKKLFPKTYCPIKLAKMQ